jgi:hypothetical protein
MAAITMAARSKARNVITLSKAEVVGSNPTRDISVYISSVFVLFYVGRGLAMGPIPVQGVLPTVYISSRLILMRK